MIEEVSILTKINVHQYHILIFTQM